MILDFNWISNDDIKKLVDIIYLILDIIRIVVPIALIIMTTIDITKKVINPDDKEGQKKIMIRAIAALIVFLIPTLINIFFKIANIDINNIDINSNKPSNTISTPVPTVNPNSHIDNLLFNNCPSENTFFKKNDEITIDTNIPNNYIGNINWSVISGNNYINISNYNNNRSVRVHVLDFPIDTKATILVETDGKKNVCNINLKNEKLSSLSFLNCPNKDKYYIIGSKIELENDVPSSFTGEINWKNDSEDSIKMNINSNQRKATLEVIDQPQNGYFIISVLAGEKAVSCLINVEVVQKLEIVNCPRSDEVYHVGDKIILDSNLPSSYKRSSSWGSLSSEDIKITPILDGRSAEIEIVNKPQKGFITVGLGADLKGTSCRISVEN